MVSLFLKTDSLMNWSFHLTMCFFSNDAKNNAQLFLNAVEIIFLTIMVTIATTQIPKTLYQ